MLRHQRTREQSKSGNDCQIQNQITNGHTDGGGVYVFWSEDAIGEVVEGEVAVLRHAHKRPPLLHRHSPSLRRLLPTPSSIWLKRFRLKKRCQLTSRLFFHFCPEVFL